MAIKSLIIGARIDTAKKAHNCQANQKHRILKGDVRLAVRNGRGWDHYCAECAKKIIDRDTQKLHFLGELNPEESQN